jgi:hypothetical protein
MNEKPKMNEMCVAVALDGAYNVYTRQSIAIKTPTDVLKVLDLLPHPMTKGVDPGMVVESYDMDVVATPEGKVLDIRIKVESVGFHAVRNYCRVAGVEAPVVLKQFKIGSPDLERFVEENGVYLLPLFGEEV